MEESLDPLTQAVAANARQRRAELSLSLDKLAEASGLHKNTLWKLEHLLQTVELPTLYKLAKGLQTTPAELVRMPSGETSTRALVDAYRASPWFQIDHPTDAELAELLKPETAGWMGAEADAEAVHLVLLALRRGKGSTWTSPSR